MNNRTISKETKSNSSVVGVNNIDQIGGALKDARRYYSRIPTSGFENLIDELEAAERLHEDDKLPHGIAIRHLQNHADYLEENGSEAKAIELRNIIEELSIDDN